MNNVGQKFLPIGTVVMLKGGSKRVMITGFCSMATEEQNVMYDYSGCMYPEGFLSSDQTALFNHSQIEKIYHLGLLDEEEQKFKTNLNGLVAQMNNVTQNSVSEVVTSVEQRVSVAPVETVEAPVPPIGPGLPGYVAPVVETPAAPVAQPVTSNGFQFDANGNVIGAPTEQVAQSLPTNIQFDENGTVVSA
jgi:hypothetical protein